MRSPRSLFGNTAIHVECPSQFRKASRHYLALLKKELILGLVFLALMARGV